MRHNPEFTMIEFYEAYATYTDLMDLTEELLKTLAQEVLGTTVVDYQGITIDFGKPYRRMTMLEAIKFYNPQLNDQLFQISILRIMYGFPPANSHTVLYRALRCPSPTSNE